MSGGARRTTEASVAAASAISLSLMPGARHCRMARYLMGRKGGRRFGMEVGEADKLEAIFVATSPR